MQSYNSFGSDLSDDKFVPKPTQVQVTSSDYSSRQRPSEEIVAGNIAVVRKRTRDGNSGNKELSGNFQSVFSGPHFLSKEYRLKTSPEFERAYASPTRYSLPKSRYFMPHIQQYVEAALEDTSRFKAYTQYRPSDPINFRHAYFLVTPTDASSDTDAIHARKMRRINSPGPSGAEPQARKAMITMAEDNTQDQESNGDRSLNSKSPRSISIDVLPSIRDSEDSTIECNNEPQLIEENSELPPAKITADAPPRKWHPVTLFELDSSAEITEQNEEEQSSKEQKESEASLPIQNNEDNNGTRNDDNGNDNDKDKNENTALLNEHVAAYSNDLFRIDAMSLDGGSDMSSLSSAMASMDDDVAPTNEGEINPKKSAESTVNDSDEEYQLEDDKTPPTSPKVTMSEQSASQLITPSAEIVKPTKLNWFLSKSVAYEARLHQTPEHQVSLPTTIPSIPAESHVSAPIPATIRQSPNEPSTSQLPTTNLPQVNMHYLETSNHQQPSVVYPTSLPPPPSSVPKAKRAPLAKTRASTRKLAPYLSYAGHGSPLNIDATSSTLLLPPTPVPNQTPAPTQPPLPPLIQMRAATQQSLSAGENSSSPFIPYTNQAWQPERWSSGSANRVSESHTHASNASHSKHDIPDRKAALEKIRSLGKFINSWRFRNAPNSCCVCFDDNANEPVESCDNPLCDVRLHLSCYQRVKKQSKARLHRRWLCDKCVFLESNSLTVACALCPSTAGLFCMINPKKYSVFWVHYNCAKAFLREEDIEFDSDLGYFDIDIDSIPFINFEQPCSDCAKISYSRYGAKVACRICRTYHHITCIEQYNLMSPGEGYECPEHGSVKPRSPDLLRRKRLASSYHRWIGKKNHFLLEEFKKVPRMYALDYWKSLNISILSMGRVTNWYKQSISKIQTTESYPVEKTPYNKWVDYVLSLTMSTYSVYEINHSKHMFTLKHFDEDIGYNFKITNESAISQNNNPLATQATNTQPSSMHGSTTQEPTTQEAIAEEPTAQEPTAQEPTAQEPTAQEPTTQEAIAEEHSINPSKKKPSKVGNSGVQPETAKSAQLSTTEPVTAKPAKKSATTQSTDLQILDMSQSGKGTRTTHMPPAVLPSDDLMCSICLQHELPEIIWKTHNLDSNYIENLERTKHKRKPGFTGSGLNWDPRVFIKCCECDITVHCGCPVPPIKSYPQRFRGFVCIRCDTKQEEAARVQEAMNTNANAKANANAAVNTRRLNVVNYKE